MEITINKTDKILIIAPHPDDDAIAVGGFISKYHSQIDILCPNSSGIKYPKDTLSAEEIAQIRINDFYKTAKKAGVNKAYIVKLWGEKVMIDKMEEHFDDYISHFNVKDYDYILVPHKKDGHPEHRYVGNVLLKKMLERQGYKEHLKILRYELWAPLSEVNYYEDISDYVEGKKELIYSYGKRGEKYYNKIISLNRYRTLKLNIFSEDKYAEAFYAETVQEYLSKTYIFNKTTDSNYRNEEFEQLLKEQNIQKRIDELAEKYKEKKVVLYGAGTFARCIFKDYDLSKLNIIAIADKRFEKDKIHEFYGLNCTKPENLKHFDYDVILVSNHDYEKFYEYLTKQLLGENKYKDIEIQPLIKL